MPDTPAPGHLFRPAAPRLQRAEGSAVCHFKTRDGITVLDRLRQSGSFKIRLPKHPDETVPEAVLLNTAGGLTGGDHFRFDGAVGNGGHAVFTTQAAERAYRSLAGEAVVETRLSAGKESRIDWLPQETILFDGSALRRSLTVDLAAGANLLAHESTVFGRTAMGETVKSGSFSDQWRVFRDGKLIHREAQRVSGAILDTLLRPACLNDAVAMATILYIAEDAEAQAEPLRAILAANGGNAGISAWEGKLILRAIAADGQGLRKITENTLKHLTTNRGLPRVWNL